jgi:hypothetical protein
MIGDKIYFSGKASPKAARRRNDMKRVYASLAVAALGGWALVVPANAAPPTVTPSPGYDARLQEQRNARVIYEPAVPVARPVARRHIKRHYDGVH